MKKISLFLCVFMQSMIASAQFTENFNDGAFTGTDRSVNWTGDVDSFAVNDGRLQLNGSKKADVIAQLRTPTSVARNGEWSFSVKMNFDPSTSNYLRIFLLSEEEDLLDPNGLFVRIGGSSDDQISLWQALKGKSNKSLITGAKDRVKMSSVSVDIRATWDYLGNFTLYSRLEGEESFTTEGTCVIQDIPATDNWFGIVCYATKSNATAFSFDDFVVQTLDPDAPTGIDPLDNPNALRIEYPALGSDQYGIHYQLDRAGYNCRLLIYDLMGRRVETVLNNEVLSSSGVIYRSFGSNLRSGVYILYMEAFDSLGNVQQFKKPVVVK
ncbi:MAG: hypothetical protein LBN93_06215 [Candidatus Symbiothrix sp.]|jgi:hypothetical protein|nr:hypothetical protein [Candidatus Symbiothrix sp.]